MDDIRLHRGCIVPEKKGLHVDRRVGIAMGALSPGQRLEVSRVLQSPQSFASHVAHQGNVKAIKGGDPQLYYLRVTPDLRLVFEKSDKGIRVVDLVDRATVARFSADKVKRDKQTEASDSGLKGQRRAPKIAPAKAAKLIEK